MVVLPALLASHKVDKVHTMKTLSTAEVDQRLSNMTNAAKKSKKSASLASTPIDSWLWRIRTQPPPQKVVPPPREIFGKEVGAGEDWGHLNKRRRRSRVGKVQRDVQGMWADVKAVKERAAAVLLRERKARAVIKAREKRVLKRAKKVNVDASLLGGAPKAPEATL